MLRTIIIIIITTTHLEDVRMYNRNIIFSNDFDNFLPSFDTSQRCTILRARKHHISSWLSVIPLERSLIYRSLQMGLHLDIGNLYCACLLVVMDEY